MSLVVVAALLSAMAVALAVPGSGALLGRAEPPGTSSGERGPDPGPLRRLRLPLSCLAGASGAVFVGGQAGWVAAVAVGAITWSMIGRIEPPGVRRRRDAVARDLPHVVTLLGAALRSGVAPGDAAYVVAAALPGPASDRLALVGSQLELGVDPTTAWLALRDEPAMSPLGRCLARAQETGAPVTAAVDRLAQELARNARADVEDRARAVGVKAAVPLGLCLLPAFLLIGIVPLVAGLMSTLAW